MPSMRSIAEEAARVREKDWHEWTADDLAILDDADTIYVVHIRTNRTLLDAEQRRFQKALLKAALPYFRDMEFSVYLPQDRPGGAE